METMSKEVFEFVKGKCDKFIETNRDYIESLPENLERAKELTTKQFYFVNESLKDRDKEFKDKVFKELCVFAIYMLQVEQGKRQMRAIKKLKEVFKDAPRELKDLLPDVPETPDEFLI